MKFFPSFFRTWLLALAVSLVFIRAGAQTIGLFAFPSTNSIGISNQLTYTIIVTNTSPAQEYITVTNTFSGPVPVMLVSYAPAVTVTNTTNSFIFYDGSLAGGETNVMTLTVEPVGLGNLTNTISASGVSGITNLTAVTNLAVSVFTTNLADLGITMSGFPAVAYSNDWVTYDVLVTNAGPAAATGVFLTNTIPAYFGELIGFSPSNQTPQTVGRSLIFNLGALAASNSIAIQFTVQVTNSVLALFSASVGTSNQMDTNLANNFAATNLLVTNFLPANLYAFTSSKQSFDHLTGREEQTITLSNAGPAAVPASRVIVSGLSNWLSNAVGTNAGNPYVLYDVPLNSGQSVNLTMQYYPDYSSFPFSNSQLTPVAIEPVDLSLPATGITSASINIYTNIYVSGHFLLIFHAITNRTYAIAYSDTGSNFLAAQPPFYVSANYGLWVDYGPPETLSNAPAGRMYQVYMYPQSP